MSWVGVDGAPIDVARRPKRLIAQPQDADAALARLVRDKFWLEMVNAGIPPRKIAAMTGYTKRLVNYRLKALREELHAY